MEAKDSLVETNKYGQAILTSQQLRQLLLQGKNISHLIVKDDNEIELYKKYQEELLNETVVFLEDTQQNLTVEEFHSKCSQEWFIPKSYQSLDVKKWLLKKCKTQEQIDRVNKEYDLYESKDLIMLLRLFIFLTDYLRKNKFVWGVGRGSSVSSYILYLIGVHRVDSMKYNLDINDYLK